MGGQLPGRRGVCPKQLRQTVFPVGTVFLIPLQHCWCLDADRQLKQSEGKSVHRRLSRAPSPELRGWFES